MKSVKTDSGGCTSLPYPKLMIGSSGAVALFLTEDYGTVVSGCTTLDRTIGMSSHKWGTSWRDYDGSICLTNDK